MTDFLLWLYYTMAGINKIVNKKYFCAHFKNISYCFSAYILYSLLILSAPLASPSGGGVSEADERGLPRSVLPASLASCLLPARRRCPGSQTGADEVLPRARTRAIYYIVGSAAHRSATPSHKSLVAFPLIFPPAARRAAGLPHKSLVVFPVLCYASYRIGV